MSHADCMHMCVCVHVHCTEQELAVLKAEFGHHAEKLDEYERMRKEIDRHEGKHRHRTGFHPG